MQVTGGKFRRLRLQSLPSQRVRPTARRVRETLFELLAARIVGARLVDLCAGSGAIGIEALSRGAAHATFVDRSARVCGFIELNLEACGVNAEQRLVVNSEAVKFLRQTAARGDSAWDIAYFDPPYSANYAPLLALFARNRLLNPQGVLAVEHHCERQLPDVGGPLHYWRAIRLGVTCLSLYQRKD